MNQHDDFHSTAVAWLKIALPLLALAILSTLFLVARTVDPSDAIPFAEVDVEDRIREPRLTQPTWAGVTDDGAALTITAADARPEQAQGNGASATQLVVDLQSPDGGRARLIAAQGVLEADKDVLTLSGGVDLTTSTCYAVTTQAMTAALDRTSIVSRTAVAGTGPAGRINAGAMQITAVADAPGQYLLVFNEGVRLLYQPGNP
jgi:lipopolysaccharide export system protein LptC